MIFDNNELARAVLFFDELGEIDAEMNIAEFQAVLDGFVPLDSMADSTLRACYIEFNNEFFVKKLVFFLLPVTSRGEVERTWQLPLMDLANGGASSKDLGAGPIKLVCRSNCLAKHLGPSLWDPDLSPRSSHLQKIKKSIARNRLGVQFREAEDDSAGAGPTSVDIARIEREISGKLRKEYAQEFRDHMAQLLKEQRLRVATTKSEFEKETLDAKRHYEKRLEEAQQLLSEKDRLIGEQKAINANLKDTVDGQAKKIEAMREYFDHKLSNPQAEENTEGLRDTIEAELSAKFEAESVELKEKLQMREVELLYRNELEVQLHDEIARLRDENQKVLANTGEQLLLKLIESGISLVAYHPGPGHITVPINELSRYLESPSAYAADKCGVKVDRYETWLAHYRMPICQNVLEEGKICGDNVDRVESPIDFEIGESDCCENCRKKKARSHLRVAGS